ncbi:MAG: SMEK domain-containing protein [Patescibacteria group bacterium]|nr:SMEK domain-containing protein [Patescibacteria group bacterium]
MYKKSIYLDKINNLLSALVVSIKNKNALSLIDGSVLSEDFFKDLLNKVYGYKFINLNEEKSNYPGIDLGDKRRRMCVQITAENAANKIKDTITTFETQKGYKEYDTLIIFVVGYKKNYRKDFQTKKIHFDKNDNIWDIRTLFKKIYSLDTLKIADISNYLDSELQNIITINPIDLSEYDIKFILETLWAYINKNLTVIEGSKKKYQLHKRENDFIARKNTLNNASDTLFDKEIIPNLKHAKEIETFLGDPINDEYQRKYFEITEAFQKVYFEDSEKFDGIESLFGFIFDEIINYQNRDVMDDAKLLIILHNMYFNCDIGNNP